MHTQPTKIERIPKGLMHGYLSSCFGPFGQLHILYWAADEHKKMQKLYYLRCAENSVDGPTLICSLPGTEDAHCCILSDGCGDIFGLYPVAEGEQRRLAWRRMPGIHDRLPGRVFLLPGRQKERYRPYYCFDGKNNLHLSWISRHEGKACLNYIQRSNGGEWRYYLQMEVPLQTLPVAPITRLAGTDGLQLVYYWEGRRGLLDSRDGGLHWIRKKGDEPHIPTGGPIHRINLENRNLKEKIKQQEEALLEGQARENMYCRKIEELGQLLNDKMLRLEKAELLLAKTMEEYREHRAGEENMKQEQINLLRADVQKFQERIDKLHRENSAMARQIAQSDPAAPKGAGENTLYRFIQKIKVPERRSGGSA